MTPLNKVSSSTFDFTKIEEIYPALLKIRCPASPINPEITKKHLEPLCQLARELKASEQAFENAHQLGTGYDDLAVILLEPSDKADSCCFGDMLSASVALQAVDSSLQHASLGKRNIHNTIILDIRLLRSDRIRKEQPEAERLRDDELAYSTFGQILSLLGPEAILVCQCQTSTVENAFARQICSSIHEATKLTVCTLPNGHKSLMVKGFHPMYVKYNDADTSRRRTVMREYLFDAGFIVAINALEGRKIDGPGLANLREYVEAGPTAIFTPDGVRITYRWSDRIGFPYLAEKLVRLGPDTEKLLSMIFQKHAEKKDNY